MAAPIHSPLQKDLSGLALFISIPQIIASPIVVGVSHLIYPKNVAFEIKDILDFIVVSFPLTLSVALLFVIIAKGKFNLFYLLFVVAGAALLSNLLHMIVGEIPSVSMENRGGNNSAIMWVFKIFDVYWNTFGPILFIQSCCIGIFAGVKYLNIEESKKKAKKKEKG